MSKFVYHCLKIVHLFSAVTEVSVHLYKSTRRCSGIIRYYALSFTFIVNIAHMNCSYTLRWRILDYIWFITIPNWNGVIRQTVKHAITSKIETAIVVNQIKIDYPYPAITSRCSYFISNRIVTVLPAVLARRSRSVTMRSLSMPSRINVFPAARAILIIVMRVSCLRRRYSVKIMSQGRCCRSADAGPSGRAGLTRVLMISALRAGPAAPRAVSVVL